MLETNKAADKPNILIATPINDEDIRDLLGVWFSRDYNLTFASSAPEAFSYIQSMPMFAAVISMFEGKEANTQFLSQAKNHDIGYVDRIVMFTCPCSPEVFDEIGAPVVCKGAFEPLRRTLKQILEIDRAP